MIRGSCLCGSVRFEVERVSEFELCHCSRCRKVSGSAFIAWLVAVGPDLRFVQGQDLVRNYDAPIREAPPAYRISFCSRCGSALPSLTDDGAWWGIPAGAFDDDPQVRPERHTYIEFKAPWETIAGELPQMTKRQIHAHRAASAPTDPAD